MGGLTTKEHMQTLIIYNKIILLKIFLIESKPSNIIKSKRKYFNNVKIKLIQVIFIRTKFC